MKIPMNKKNLDLFEFHKRTTLDDEIDEAYCKKMIKQKEEFDEFKKREGDSDLVFNKKDNGAHIK